MWKFQWRIRIKDLSLPEWHALEQQSLGMPGEFYEIRFRFWKYFFLRSSSTWIAVTSTIRLLSLKKCWPLPRRWIFYLVSKSLWLGVIGNLFFWLKRLSKRGEVGLTRRTRRERFSDYQLFITRWSCTGGLGLARPTMRGTSAVSSSPTNSKAAHLAGKPGW